MCLILRTRGTGVPSLLVVITVAAGRFYSAARSSTRRGARLVLTGLAVVWWLVGVLVPGIEVGQNVGVHVGPQDLVLTGQHRHYRGSQRSHNGQGHSSHSRARA